MQGQLFDRPPAAEPWPAKIGAMLSGDPEARARARWHYLVLEVTKRLERFVPAHHPFPAVLDGVTLEQIVEASGEGGDRTILAAFAAWRADVRHLEVTNEKRLRALAGALETLADLRARGWGDPEEVARQEQRIRAHLTDVWRRDPPAPGERPRTWAAKHAVDHSLLPPSWRNL